MSDRRRPAWETHNEIQFLTKAGTWGERQRDPRKVLKGYLKSCEHARDWGVVDRDKVVRYAENLLESLG